MVLPKMIEILNRLIGQILIKRVEKISQIHDIMILNGDTSNMS